MARGTLEICSKLENDIIKLRSRQGCLKNIYNANDLKEFVGWRGCSDEEMTACLLMLIHKYFSNDEDMELLLVGLNLLKGYNDNSAGKRREKYYNDYFSHEDLTKDALRKRENNIIKKLAQLIIEIKENGTLQEIIKDMPRKLILPSPKTPAPNKLTQLSIHDTEIKEKDRIQSAKNFLEWSDFEKYVNIVVKKIRKSEFIPTHIYISSLHNAITASMIARLLSKPGTTIPVSAGLMLPKSDTAMFHKKSVMFYTYKHPKLGDILIPNNIPEENLKNFNIYKHSDWGYVFIPKTLLIENTDKILIISDHSNTGICFDIIKNHLINNCKVIESQIKTACIAYSEGTRYNPPNYYGFQAKDDVWFPWGKNI